MGNPSRAATTWQKVTTGRGCGRGNAPQGRCRFREVRGGRLGEAYDSGMVPASNLWAFVVASVVLIVIPGPSVLFVIGRSLALGRVGGLLSVVGNAIGMLPLV